MMQNFATFKTALHFYGLLQRYLPNPDTVLRKTGNSIGVYRDLFADAHLSGCLRSRKAPVIASEWVLERNECPAKLFKPLKNWFESLPLNKFMENFMDVVFWGYQPVEILWNMQSGLWLPDQIIPKPPEWFHYYVNAEGETELRFLSVKNPIDGELPPDDFTLIAPAIAASYDNPYGNGVAGKCFWPIFFKKAGMEFWLNFSERFAIPWVKGKTGQGISDVDTKKFQQNLENLIQDAVIVVTGTDDVDLLSDSGRGNAAGMFQTLCRYMDTEMSKAVLSQTLTTEVQERGALATAQVHSGVRDDVTDADLKTASGFFQELIRLIFLRNGFTPNNKDVPKVRPYEEEDTRMGLAQRDGLLAPVLHASGIRLTRAYFIKKYNMEEKDLEESKTPEPAETPDPALTPPDPAFSEPETPDLSDLEKEQAEIDQLVSDGIEISEKTMREMMEQIISAAKGAKSYEEVMGRVATALPYNKVGQLSEELLKTMFFSQLRGQADAEI